jgi:vacuolar-type H+-ATPase subunit H
MAMSDADNGSEQDLEQAIRERAFLLWEMEGSPEGREDEYWHRAREQIEAETNSASPPAQAGK